MEKSVKRRLEVRRATDSRKFGRKFAETHYINAAFKNRPRELDVLTQITDAYLDSRGDSLYRARGQTTRLEPEVAQDMDDLAIDIREQVAYGFIGKVQSALVSLLLDELDQIDQVADGSVQDLDRLST